MRPFTVGLEPETLRRLQDMAAEQGMTTGKLCREILEDFVGQENRKELQGGSIGAGSSTVADVHTGAAGSTGLLDGETKTSAARAGF